MKQVKQQYSMTIYSTIIITNKQTNDNLNSDIHSILLKKPTQKMNDKILMIRPDPFSGNEDVRKYFKQYEKAADVIGWKDKDKERFLSAFVKGTESTFLENLEEKHNNWTWNNLKQEFLDEFQPIGYNTILKSRLENRRQEDTESIMSFVTEIENICRQLNNMNEDEICTYILKGIRETVLHAISLHDNSNLKALKKNLKKIELMQFRINNREPELSDYTKILNEHVSQLNQKTREKGKEIDELKRQSLSRERHYHNKIQNETHKNQDYDRKPNYKYVSKNYEHKDNSRDRESNINTNNGRGYRNRSHSRDQHNNGEYNYSNRHQYSREHSREKTPERYRGNHYSKEAERVTCYRCNVKGHYADKCTNTKTKNYRVKKKFGLSNSGINKKDNAKCNSLLENKQANFSNIAEHIKEVEHEGIDKHAIIDTGSNISCIDILLIKNIKYIKKEKQVTITSANNTKLEQLSKIDLMIKIKKNNKILLIQNIKINNEVIPMNEVWYNYHKGDNNSSYREIKYNIASINYETRMKKHWKNHIKRDKDYVIELKECLSKNKYLKLESTSFNTDDGITIYNFSKLYSNIPKGMPIANLINTKPSKLQDDTVEVMDKQGNVIKISNELNTEQKKKALKLKKSINIYLHQIL
ncbi:GATA zinc finger domain-containing protein 14-like [Aphis craccivora]|uniref:GATA zinc finger domain-containing protein 14-like n=1 Tax=Aphis craccivora TaxID=307492 RepID=A0A6G0YJ28_APHCR|nr:GATA zinc finger domain-containing protein 14-like [Aphis craccivora]